MATDLTNTQWEIVRHLIPEPERERTGSRGGRPWREPREVLNGILWVLRTGARWADLPRRYPPPQTCHRRFQKWTREGVLDALLRALADDLRERLGDAREPVASAADLSGPVLLWPRAPRRWHDQTVAVLASPRGMQALGGVLVSSADAVALSVVRNVAQ